MTTTHAIRRTLVKTSQEDEAVERIFREGAWKYFILHAEQRLKLFQFYITISTALLGGGFLIIRLGDAQWILIIFGLFSSFVSFIFWKLDIRTRNLVKLGEEALKTMDKSHEIPDLEDGPSPLKLFERDEFLVKKHSGSFRLNGHFSYRRCFEWVFLTGGSLGFLGAIYGIYQLFHCP